MPSIVAMPSTVATVGAVVSLVDVIARAFGLFKSTFQATSKEHVPTVERILNICQEVQKIADQIKKLEFPATILAIVDNNLKIAADIAEKYKYITFHSRIKHMPKALSRLGKLEEAEQQMQTVLALITFIAAGKTFENTERIVVLLERQKLDLTQMLRRIDKTSTQILDAIRQAEILHGPFADLALDDQVDKLLRQRFDRLDDSVAHLQGDMKTLLHDELPAIKGMSEGNQDPLTRFADPVELGLRDNWTRSYSSVPARPPCLVETQYIRNLKNVLLDETGESRLVTVHGSGGAGKTTACKMLANDDSVRQRFADGIIWIELGETASSTTLIERLARAVKHSGGEKTSEYIIRQTDAGKLDLAKEEFQNWFDSRKVLFVLDNIWESKDRTFNRWINALREIPGNQSSLLCSSRTPLGVTNVNFTQLSGEEQTKIFLSHLQLRQDSNEYQANVEFAETILQDCAGLPLALAMSAGYLRRDPNGWKTLSDSIRKNITAEENPNFTIAGHTGLSSVIQTSMEWLVREKTLPQDCLLSWAELYTSLCVTDRASPGLPLSVLSLMWGMCAESVLEVCQTFFILSLATLSTGSTIEKRMVTLHDLQRQYCSEQCARARKPSHNSAQSIAPESSWHRRMIEGLFAKTAVPMVLDNSTDGGQQAASTGLQAGTATAEAVVAVFIDLAKDSALEEYFVKNLVRHICGFEDESFVVLARGVLSDYRWLLAVASRQSLSLAASQYCAVANRMLELRESNEGLKGSEVALEFGRGFIRDIESIAEILRLCVPPAAVELQGSGEEEPCALHGVRSVGDPGLAHQLVGRLGFGSSDDTRLVLEVNDGKGGGSSGVYRLVDMLVSSIRRWAEAPWLVPLNRFYFEADRRGLNQVIRGASHYFISCTLGDRECVAVGSLEGIRVYYLVNGDVIHVLREKGAGEISSIAVAGEGCGVKREVEVGNVGVDKVVWLAAGHKDGSVGVWDLDSGVCVSTLYPRVALQKSYSRGVSVAADWSRVVHFTKSSESPDKGGLHVWDLSSDGTPEGYALVEGCKNRFGFELASAALLHQDSKRRSVQQCSNRAVRFERTSLQPGKRKKTTYFPHLGHRLRKGSAGCLTSNDENELSEVTDSTLRMTVENSLVAGLAESNFKACCRVSNCKAGVLVAAVNTRTGVITVLDALTCEKVNEFSTATDEKIWSVAAFQREEDGRVLVVTGDGNGMIRMRVADSGELIEQWQAMRGPVYDVAISVKAGKVVGVYENDLSVWIWSFGGEGRFEPNESDGPAIADGMTPSRATDDEARNNQFHHSDSVHSIAFSEDGKVAASCSSFDGFVLVWDPAAGTVTRKLDIISYVDYWIRPRAVAVLSCGDWIICVSTMEGERKNAYLNLWGPSNQEFSASFLCGIKMRPCCVTIHSSFQERLSGEILCQSHEDEYETYEWALSSSSDPEIIITATAASDDVVSDLIQTGQGSRNLLLQRGKNGRELHVQNAALDGVNCCTCKAAAVFDFCIHAHCAWIEPNAQSSVLARARSKAAVGLADGTVHFMELCWNEPFFSHGHDSECDSEWSTHDAKNFSEKTLRTVDRDRCDRILHDAPSDNSVVQDDNGMGVLVESLVERTSRLSTETAERARLSGLHEESRKFPRLGGTWEGADAPAFRPAGELPDVILEQAIEHVHAVSDVLTQSRVTAPSGNAGVHCNDVSFPSLARQADEASLSAGDASPENYMDCEPAASEYDVASNVLNGITTDTNIVEKLARFFTYNAVSLKSLGMDAHVPGNRIQENWLNASIVASDEGVGKTAAQFIAVFLSLSEESEQGFPRPPSRTAFAFEAINPVLCQVILLFAEGDPPLDLVGGDRYPMSKDWYNCVFNSGGSKDVPIVLEVDVSHHDNRQYFNNVEYAEHIKGKENFAIAVGSPNARKPAAIASGMRRPFSRSFASMVLDKDVHVTKRTTLIAFSDSEGGLNIVNTPVRGVKILPNQVGVGVASINVSTGASPFYDAKADQVHQIVGKDIVMFLSSLEEYLCAPIYMNGRKLCVQRKVECLRDILKKRERRLFRLGCCILCAIDFDFRNILTSTTTHVFQNHSGCQTSEIPGILRIQLENGEKVPFPEDAADKVFCILAKEIKGKFRKQDIDVSRCENVMTALTTLFSVSSIMGSELILVVFAESSIKFSRCWNKSRRGEVDSCLAGCEVQNEGASCVQVVECCQVPSGWLSFYTNIPTLRWCFRNARICGPHECYSEIKCEDDYAD